MIFIVKNFQVKRISCDIKDDICGVKTSNIIQRQINPGKKLTFFAKLFSKYLTSLPSWTKEYLVMGEKFSTDCAEGSFSSSIVGTGLGVVVISYSWEDGNRFELLCR